MIVQPYTRPWWGRVVGCRGDGDPGELITRVQRGYLGATRTAITTSIARLSFFLLEADLNAVRMLLYGIGASSSAWRFAIYEYGATTCARLSDAINPTLAAATWTTIDLVSGGAPITLRAGTPYFLAVSVISTSNVAACACFGSTIAAGTGQINTAPNALPGYMDMDNGLIGGYLAQAPVTTGALPTSFTTSNIVGQAAWTGGMPAAWLEAA